MEAESSAYPQASLYRRTVVQVEQAPGRQYVADIFRVRGGAKHEYVFHGPNNEMQVEGPTPRPLGDPGVDVKNARASDEVAPWMLTWKISDDMSFCALWSNGRGETTLFGDGWGQRDYRNSDVGATLPYIVRRRAAGRHPSVFTAVFEGCGPGQAVVKGVKTLPVPEAEADNATAMAIETDRGTDYLVSCLEARPLKVDTPAGPLETNGRFAFVSVQNGALAAARLVEGTRLAWNGKDVMKKR
jgi:hypothetical protein